MMDEHPFDSLGVTPELTEALEQMSHINTAIIMVEKLREQRPDMVTPDLLKLAAMCDRLMPLMVARVNSLMAREEQLRRGL